MKGDIPEWAFRMSMMLPVRTHVRPEYVRPGVTHEGRQKGTTAIRVRVGKMVYPSFYQAMARLKIGDAKLKRMIERGEAKIVK